ncbi:hypothetical protein EVAR_103061_1 [Eumeta japonica]|uniref:Uncharacterized protein n=1 Tax=Eumeta variegata TaxID=151549 RepID=A0A4C1WME3_EUMVA|nr:hypothetical protein EVAR_103061_1 [Eumeta japonica]
MTTITRDRRPVGGRRHSRRVTVELLRLNPVKFPAASDALCARDRADFLIVLGRSAAQSDNNRGRRRLFSARDRRQLEAAEGRICGRRTRRTGCYRFKDFAPLMPLRDEDPKSSILVRLVRVGWRGSRAASKRFPDCEARDGVANDFNKLEHHDVARASEAFDPESSAEIIELEERMQKPHRPSGGGAEQRPGRPDLITRCH